MFEENNEMKIFSGYAIKALQSLDYSEIAIRDIICEIERQVNNINNIKALGIFNKFVEDSIKPIIFDGIKIPEEYNILTIKELFEKYGFYGKEKSSMGKRICEALRRRNIVYIKDLREETRDTIMSIRCIGIESYKFFTDCLKKICINLKN